MLAAAWYGQGLRLLDIHNARDLRQVGYYRVTRRPAATRRSTRPRTRGTRRSRATSIYLFDMARGVEVLRDEEGRQRRAADEVGRRAEPEALAGTRPSRSAGSTRQRLGLGLPAVRRELSARWDAVPRRARRPATAPCAQRAEDRARGGRAVERVEVDARARPWPAGRRTGASRRRRRSRPPRPAGRRAASSSASSCVGDRRAAHAREALDLLEVGDRHDPRDDRDVDRRSRAPGRRSPSRARCRRTAA